MNCTWKIMTLMNKIKDDINRWRNVPSSWEGRVKIVKMTILPNSVLQIQSYSYQLPKPFFRTRTKISTIHMETQNTINSQSSLEKEEWSWMNQFSWLQTVLQSYSHQDIMILAQKEKYRPMEQDKEARDKPMHLWVPYFWQMRQAYSMWQR